LLLIHLSDRRFEMRVLLVLAFLLSTSAFSKIPEEYLKLHRLSLFEEKRMIAGYFENSRRKISKKTYLESLRSKLQGTRGVYRF
jgi:hypothetical protein